MKIKFFPSIVYMLVVITLLRLTALIGISIQVPQQEYAMLWGLSFWGYLTDLVAFFAIVFGLTLIFRRNGLPKLIMAIGLVLFHVLLLAHLPLLVYFIDQRIPLGVMLYQHSFDEIYLTATNAGYSFKYLILVIGVTMLIFGSLFYLVQRIVRKKFLQVNVKKVLYAFLACLFYLLCETGSNYRDESYYVNISKYFYTESLRYYWVKTHPISLKWNQEKVDCFQRDFPQNYLSNDFPLLHSVDTIDYLANYFNEFDKKPNVVFLIVEGLNDDFIHDQKGLTLMPFLGQLKDQSLYWENCFTLGERSFAAVPSVLGALPYANKGFMQLEAYPRFTSMVNVLKSNDYHVRFNYGQGAWFHSKDQFFKWQNVDVIFDKEVFDPNLTKMMADDGYFWGYDDKTLLTEAIKNLPKYPNQPFMEVYFTGSMHSPYAIPQQAKYLDKLQKGLLNVKDENYKSQLNAFAKYYATTFFTDDAIRQFITDYSKRADFQNTIFVITGDHPMTEAPIQNSLKRYHVPLLIYSPKLKQTAISKNVVSHLDVQQTLFNILRKYQIKVPETSVGLGKVLKVEGEDINRSIVFMNGHRFVEDIYKDGYFLSKDQLYKVQKGFMVEKVVDAIVKNDLSAALEAFQWVNLYTTNQQRLLPVDDYLHVLGKKLVARFNPSNSNGNTSEFQDWLKGVELNEDAMLELYFKDQTNNPDLRVVVVLKNKENEDYFYQDVFCNQGQTYAMKIPLRIQEAGDLLQIYVYNPAKVPVRMYAAEALIY